MHLEVPAQATLEDLDRFLRRTWLECCGHMSAFEIGGQRYSVGPLEEFDEQDLLVALGNVLEPRLKFTYEYDFGTTTHLALKVVSEREGEMKPKSVRILARNDPPPIPCESCGKPATLVCSVCIYTDEAWYCDDCTEKHTCGEDYFLPVVNSPRVGMCGYTGEIYD